MKTKKSDEISLVIPNRDTEPGRFLEDPIVASALLTGPIQKIRHHVNAQVAKPRKPCQVARQPTRSAADVNNEFISLQAVTLENTALDEADSLEIAWSHHCLDRILPSSIARQFGKTRAAGLFIPLAGTQAIRGGWTFGLGFRFGVLVHLIRSFPNVPK